MARKLTKSVTDSAPTNGSKAKRDRASAKSKTSTNGRKTPKASGKKTLSREEKLEAIRKANQAMMKAWELISQRKNSEIDAQDNI
jgi:hypothetical protein